MEDRFVTAFDGESRAHRDKLFRGLEEAVQDLLRVRLPCQICVDGSFVTEKPEPEDIDIVVAMDADVGETVTEHQRQVLDLLNGSNGYYGLDSFAYFNYSRDHPLFGCGVDAYTASADYGLEHAGYHLKGFVVLRLQETNVGFRIHR